MLIGPAEIKPTEAFLRLKVPELKEVCLAGGLSRQGRKADLQQRILTAMRHGGRVQQALERLLPSHLPFARGPASSAPQPLGIPLVSQTSGTEKLRCP